MFGKIQNILLDSTTDGKTIHWLITENGGIGWHLDYPTAAYSIAGDYGNEAQSCSISVKVAYFTGCCGL